ncbi:MAG TPA: serine hydrolase domain-containing protein [Trebonia sp.]|nr:serine hydrolase domain-containing protein [Trebonia sp.]
MSVMTDAVGRLLALGADGSHPASAIAGVHTAGGTTIAAAGWAELPAPGRPGQPMSTEVLLDLASVTKVAATTTLIMRLVADGQLDLRARARQFLPSFTGAGKDDITLEQLLTHTAGLPPWWPLYFEAADRDGALAAAQALPLDRPAGTAWRYSDLGLILAGRIVEQVTTLSLADAFRQLVAQPLGLSARYGPVPAGQAAASADSDAYELGMIATGRPYPVPFTPGQFPGWRNRPLRGEVNDGNAAHALGGVAGHAGLFASVGDLLRLGAALRGGDFVPPPVLARFATATAVHPEQAVGFRRAAIQAGGRARTLLWHGGFTGTYFAFAVTDELVVGGGAMRLYGTLGAIDPEGRHPDASRLATGTDIQSVLLNSAAMAFEQALIPAIPAEER